jgi:hypothetical protein
VFARDDLPRNVSVLIFFFSSCYSILTRKQHRFGYPVKTAAIFQYFDDIAKHSSADKDANLRIGRFEGEPIDKAGQQNAHMPDKVGWTTVRGPRQIPETRQEGAGLTISRILKGDDGWGMSWGG